MRALPKLNDERPGTVCDDVLDTGHSCAAVARLPAVCSVATQTSRAPTRTMLKVSFARGLDYVADLGERLLRLLAAAVRNDSQLRRRADSSMTA